MNNVFRNLVLIEGDLKPLLKKLKRGSVVKGRIVLPLTENRYLFRLMGRNLIMESKIKFERTEEVYFKVLGTYPRIELRIFDPRRELLMVKSPQQVEIVV